MYECEICGRQFSYKNSVNRHFLREHINKRSRRKITCTECPFQCRFYSNLRAHIYLTHGTAIKVERRSFLSIEEFYAWKKKFEHDTHYSYVKHSSSKVSSLKHEKKTYFVCHRTGTFLSGSSGKRKLKSIGSNKINASCPSTMEVVESSYDGTVKVVVWKTHLGHDADIERTFLSNEERDWLAAKIMEGTSYQKIMSDVELLGPNYKRIQYLKSQDVRNIRKNLLKSRFNKLYSGISSWIKNMWMFKGRERSVVLFKGQNSPDSKKMLANSDVILIIMTEFQKHILRNCGQTKVCFDATHCVQGYDFHLITLFISDKMNSWCPVSYFIANRIDTVALKYFLSCVKDTVGCINCSIFLSADVPLYYDVWCTIMSKPEFKFIHSWVVDEDWKSNLLKIDGNETFKQTVYANLTMLLMETDPYNFEHSLYHFSEELLFNRKTLDFGYYFKDVYVSRPLLWAHCYRLGLGLDREMHLENVHKRLNHLFYEGLDNSTLEESINLIIKVSRDSDLISKQILNICEHSKKQRIKNIRKNHNLNLVSNEYDIKELFTNSFQVKCRSSNYFYIVQYLDTKACGCFLNCNSCRICIHSYSCNCPDNIVNYNICEHIHSCAMFKDTLSIESVKEERDILDDFVEEVICEEIICEETIPSIDPLEDNIICEEVYYNIDTPESDNEHGNVEFISFDEKYVSNTSHDKYSDYAYKSEDSNHSVNEFDYDAVNMKKVKQYSDKIQVKSATGLDNEIVKVEKIYCSVLEPDVDRDTEEVFTKVYDVPCTKDTFEKYSENNSIITKDVLNQFLESDCDEWFNETRYSESTVKDEKFLEQFMYSRNFM